MFVYCAAHFLNLKVSISCSIQSIKNCLGTVEKAHDFFMYPGRKHKLSQYTDRSEQEIHAKLFKHGCATS